MISRVQVMNYQSLKDVDIELGKITIILGDSNSGKSAFMRAVNALGKGMRGSTDVTHGEKKMSVTATTEDWIVVLERTGTKTSYKLVNRNTNFEQDLPKGLGAVPEKILEVLGSNATSYADQHDTPFLLKDPGAEVARKLGELTNVNTILLAVGNGLKYRGRLVDELKIRESDLKRVQTEIEKFEDLTRQVESVENVETLIAQAKQDEQQLAALDDAIATFESSYQLLTNLPEYPEVPDTASIEKLHDIYSAIDSLVSIWETSEKDEERYTELMADAERDLITLDDDLHSLLVKVGRCPTCNQTVTD